MRNLLFVLVGLLLIAPVSSGFATRTPGSNEELVRESAGPPLSAAIGVDNPVASRLAAVQALLEHVDTSEERGFAGAVRLAQEANAQQAGLLGIELDPGSPRAAHATPSEALRALLDLNDVTPTRDQHAELRALDDLQEPVRGALTNLVDAFLDFDAASRVAFEDGEASTLGTQSVRVGLGPVLAARGALLEAVLDFELALAVSSPTPPGVVVPASQSSPVEVAPVFSIDLTGTSRTYGADEPFVLLVDTGGSDTYLNNAGGNNLGIGAPVPAAALVDLGYGHDTYGSEEAPRSSGANGGGSAGAGFLVDDGGNDQYTAGGLGTNGGGRSGAGFVLDGGGNDNYTAAGQGTNGGAFVGTGLLVDGGGNDKYTAGSLGTNGGGVGVDGNGFLVDDGGNDKYFAGSQATNGGAFSGSGLLLDTEGNDLYVAGNRGVNGGSVSGVSLLYDRRGNDEYIGGEQGTNGGTRLGVALLIDDAGNDTYNASGTQGTNGGADFGVSALLDNGGFDTYEDGEAACSNPPDDATSCTVVPKGTVGAQIDRA